LLTQVPLVRHVDAGAMDQKAVSQAPWGRQLPRLELRQQLLGVRRGYCCPPDGVQKLEGWSRHGEGCCSRGHQDGCPPMYQVPARESVCHDVQAARTVLYREVETK